MKKKLIKIGIFVFIILCLVINHIYMYKKSANAEYIVANFQQMNLEEEEVKNYKLGEKEIIQTIYATNNNLNKIRIFLDPIKNRYESSDYIETNLEFELKDEDGNTIEKYKYEKVFFESGIKAIPFSFPEIKDSENKKYYLYITAYKKDNFTNIRLGKNPNNEKFNMYENNELSEYSLFYTTSYYYNVDDMFFKVTFIVAGVFLALLIGIVVWNNKLKIEKKYFFIAFIVCLLMNFLTPLFHGNDELAHWYRIQEIAKGNMVTDIIDGWPKSTISSDTLDITFDMYYQIPSRLRNDDSVSQDIQVNMEYMAVYSPVSYLPQVVGLLFGRLTTNNLFISAYMARLFQILFCITLIAFAIKIIPFGKKVVFTIGLLPSFILASSLLSTDGILFSTSILFIAKILQLVYEKKEINKKDYGILGLLSVIIAISKLVYFPICLFLLLIPFHQKEKDKKKAWYIVMGILFISFLIIGLWNIVALRNLTNGQGVNAVYYIKHYLEHPIEFFQITFYTFYVSIGNFISDIFGGINAWYGTQINDASIFPQIFLLLYLILSLKEENELKMKDKWLVMSILVITYLLISTSLLITCTPVYYKEIIGIQGRYFVPFLLPIVLLIANTNKIKTPKIKIEYIIILAYFTYFLRYIISYL